jgi:hypothetical protein
MINTLFCKVSKKSRQDESIQERGSIEAGLVLIPTTILFLLIVQLIIAQSWQSLETAKLHDDVNRILISAPNNQLYQLESQLSGKNEFDLSKDQKVLTITRHIAIPVVSKLIGDRATVRVNYLVYL